MPETAAKPEAPPRTKRRLFQFSMRAMLAWITIISVLLAIGTQWIAPAQQQRVAVQMVQSVGGHVRYADIPSNESWLKTQLREWFPRDYFDHVTRVDCSGSSIADADLPRLGGFGQLEVVNLSNTRLTGVGLVHLLGLRQLHRLDLEHARICEIGFVHLSRLTMLREIDLSNSQITDADLANLGRLDQLQELDLGGTRITDAGLMHLSDLAQLEWLYLYSAPITETGKRQLSRKLPKCAIIR